MVLGVKAEVPVDTGTLKKSIDQKVYGRGDKVTGIVGSNMAMMGADGEPAARHLHLVEFGFMHEGGQVVAGQAPLRRGREAAASEIASTYERKMAEGAEKAAAQAATVGAKK